MSRRTGLDGRGGGRAPGLSRRDDRSQATEPGDPSDDAAAAALVAEMARAFSAYLDGTYPPGLCAEARLWRRVSKVDEETGEVQQALRAYLGENPRKPVGPIEDVVKELCDVAVCALGALEHVTGNQGRSLRLVADRLAHCCGRAGVSHGG